jgi:hypothetical protein
MDIAKQNNLLEAALFYIKSELDRLMWNKYQKQYDNPFDNTGEDFKNDVFEVKSYDWGFEYEGKELDKTPHNFSWRDFKVYWYKYLGRGTKCNRSISNKEIAIMLDECLESLKE